MADYRPGARQVAGAQRQRRPVPRRGVSAAYVQLWIPGDRTARDVRSRQEVKSMPIFLPFYVNFHFFSQPFGLLTCLGATTFVNVSSDVTKLSQRI